MYPNPQMEKKEVKYFTLVNEGFKTHSELDNHNVSIIMS